MSKRDIGVLSLKRVRCNRYVLSACAERTQGLAWPRAKPSGAIHLKAFEWRSAQWRYHGQAALRLSGHPTGIGNAGGDGVVGDR